MPVGWLYSIVAPKFVYIQTSTTDSSVGTAEDYSVYIKNLCTSKLQPPIAQLVERETVDYIQKQISLGRWFKSGSVDIFLDLVFKIRIL